MRQKMKVNWTIEKNYNEIIKNQAIATTEKDD